MLCPFASLGFLFAFLITCSGLQMVAHAELIKPTRIEASFDVPGVSGNPFDYLTNDVMVEIALPNGSSITLPAFFDGDNVWRVRHTPTMNGRYDIRSIRLNGKPVKPAKLSPRTFDVTQAPASRRVSIDPQNAHRFVHADGSTYYPLGTNLGWHHRGDPPMPPLVETLARMSAAGMNWSRVWMNHWDGKNLDWVEHQPITLGHLHLAAARQWDAILDACDAHGIHIQIALQHHGQYSTRADANWHLNPWNKANGGWLDSPADFFTDEKARALTKAKYRYIIARFGYSDAVMAWELFNEVEGTDAYEAAFDSVVAWHNEMAAFIRAHDPYKHLITTSSRTADAPLWTSMDFYNPHVYAPDIVAAIQNLEEQSLDRAYFYGEIGAAAHGPQLDPAATVRDLLWASLMSRSSGAAQYWYWDAVFYNDLYAQFFAARQFLDASALAEQSNLKPLALVVETAGRGPLRFGPGTGWSASKITRFIVKQSGTIEGLGGMSAYLQGKLNERNHAMFPHAEFVVNFAEPGTFSVSVDEITSSGATLDISIDGKGVSGVELMPPLADTLPAGERSRRNPRVNATLSVPIDAGEHTIRVENLGRDWVHLRQFSLTPYASLIGALGKGNDHYAAIWLYRREAGASAAEGQVLVPGLKPGNYRVNWFDTARGTLLRSEVHRHEEGAMCLATGLIASDVAMWIQATNDAPTTRPTTSPTSLPAPNDSGK